jgi:hypothetical protein|nr:MAG TPA: Structural Protein [Caudoviricetes sp.]DAX30942.1 MAG TPA: Structural Protein [Caudoviricetes sp.]
MSIFSPVNGAPMTIALGTDDKSIKQRLYERAPRSIHLPLVYAWAEWGPLDAQVVYGNTIPLTYGDETLNLRGKFANHATNYLSLFISNANPILFKRLVPKDIGPEASIRLYADVLETELDEIEREVDGSFKRDNTGQFVLTGNRIQGVKLKFVTEVIPRDPNDPTGRTLEFFKGRVKNGTITDGAGNTSKMYPLFDVKAPHLGSRGNNFGFRIWAPTEKDTVPVKSNILDVDKSYPFRMTLIRRVNEQTSSKVVDNNYGEKFDDFCLKPDLVDTDYNKDRDIIKIFVKNFQDLNPPAGNPLRYGPIGEMQVYRDNVERILRMILEHEKDQTYPYNDLQGKSNATDSEDFYRVNLFGLQQPVGIPYQTARFDNDPDAIRFTENTDIFMEGASDGTLTDREFADQVEAELDEWNDPNSEYQDILMYPCSYFWDSGFPLSTKYKMGKFISQRKNTNVSIATYINGEKPLTTSEESSRHIAIVERVRGFAESDYFATPTMRASVVSRSGEPLSSSWRGRLPCNYELANMVSKLAAGTSFRRQYLFDRVPYNRFELLGNISSLWAPPSIRNKDWAMGMMWPERLDYREVYFAAAKTVYKDDTSVLNNVITAMAIAELQTIGILCQKQFSGGLFTKPQLKVRVEDYCRDNMAKRFGDLYMIEPECFFTDADDHRGYSWTLRIKIYAPMMRTVETLWVEAYDRDDLPADSPAFIS